MNGLPPPPACEARVPTLRELPLAARLTLALFLISVGIGYVSALVQLHFQHASPGQELPTMDDAVHVFHGDVGDKPKSKIEQLLPESESAQFGGQGQMTAAFTIKSREPKWKEALREKAKAIAATQGERRAPLDLETAERQLREERNSERLAVLAWIEEGASKQDYQQDSFCLPARMARRPITKSFLIPDADPPAVKIKSLLDARCARCHSPEGEDGAAAQFPLETYEHIKSYITVQSSTGMSMTKLAQTTHVHLLGFSLLYGLTGLILAFSSYPRLLRIVLCPLPLLAQVVDISFWWLARLPEPQGPMFARAIVISGAIVAVGLLLHIVLSLFNLFRWKGWLILLLMFAATGYAGYVAKTRVIDPFLAQEKAPEAAAK